MPVKPMSAEEKDRRRRMAWWHQARFGMFIHWGLYSQLGRHEWVMNRERIPVKEYEKLADQWHPKPNAARAWARLAKQAGQRYMVMTTKHHEGFCLFKSDLTDYCAPKRGPGRDLVSEYVEAARGEGLRVGFYYSLMDWHHPDGFRCHSDERARRRFVDYIHGQVRELCANYGKLDILWYDVAWPLDAEGWESVRMNKMVRSLQPDIIINNRSKVPEDFSTPEQHVTAEAAGRAWEACMTINNSWGYSPADDDWKTARTCVEHLVCAAAGGGNYLLNIGPRADGSIPEPSARVLRSMGRWLAANEEAIRDSDRGRMDMLFNIWGRWTAKGNTAYLHVFAWPGRELVVGGRMSKVRSARFLATGKGIRYRQERDRLFLLNLPEKAPDSPATVIAIECAGAPRLRLGAGCKLLPAK